MTHSEQPLTVVLIAPGSRGDVQPFIALGQGLRAAGHTVRLVTNLEFEALVASYGLELWPVDVNVQAALQGADASAAIERGGVLTSFRKLAQLAREGARKLVTVGNDAARGADVLVSGFGGILTGEALAERHGLPHVQAYNVPLTDTAEFPGALLPGMSVWPKNVVHRLSHALTRQVVWQTARSAGNPARTELLGLGPAPLFASRRTFGSGHILYGFSPAFLPRPADWSDNIRVTGFWFVDEPAGWLPDRALLDFLEAGAPPVYIGFGSMSSEHPAELMRLILDALAIHGRRAVVHSGWAGLASATLPANVLTVGSLPHAWLFPRVSAIVHHGGAGTTAAAVRAGKPAVVVPFHGDQPFWARLAHQRGVATAPLPRRELTAQRLAEAIEHAVGDVALRRTAADLGARVGAEDGVSAAVAVIEAVGRRDGVSPAASAQRR